MQTTLPTTTCPTWCVNPHNAGTVFHYAEDTRFRDLNGLTANVSTHYDDKAGRAAVFVDGHEFTPNDARAFAAEIVAAADRGELALRSTEVAGVNR